MPKQSRVDMTRSQTKPRLSGNNRMILSTMAFLLLFLTAKRKIQENDQVPRDLSVGATSILAKPQKNGISQVALTGSAITAASGFALTQQQQQQQQPLLKIPTPILVLSLPKSGTTSTHRYLQCGNVTSVHHVYNRTLREKVGHCLRSNVERDRPMLEDCGPYQAWADVGVVDAGKPCFYPGVHGLDNLATHYTTTTNNNNHAHKNFSMSIILVVRNHTAWLKSARKHRSQTLVPRWQRKCAGFPNDNATDWEWMNFYENYTRSIRHFARDHPSIAYLEVTLEDVDTPRVLHEATGISPSCWGCSNSHHGCKPQS